MPGGRWPLGTSGHETDRLAPAEDDCSPRHCHRAVEPPDRSFSGSQRADATPRGRATRPDPGVWRRDYGDAAVHPRDGQFPNRGRGTRDRVGVSTPIGGALLGFATGCGPQIVFPRISAQGGIPFSALTVNAISQDGDALFLSMAIDMKAAIVATIYTTIPALVVGIVVYHVWPFASFRFGVL